MDVFSKSSRFCAITLATVVCSTPAFAVKYLTVEEAQKIIFPQDKSYIAASETLTERQKSMIEERIGTRFDQSNFHYWKVVSSNSTRGYFFVDEVIGKHELITYAVGFSSDKKILGVEILEYRETHGGEVRASEWREQFKGKSAASLLTVGDDITNISGATLSCVHLTEGIKGLAHLLEILDER